MCLSLFLCFAFKIIMAGRVFASVSLHSFHSDIFESDIDAALMTSLGGSPPLDILIRTSGVKRLSDYMLWQVRFNPS
jgi:undecaprenyl diphosphate synthase